MKAIAAAADAVVVLLNVNATAQDVLEQASRLVQTAAVHDQAARANRSMDLRTYGLGAQILRDLGVGKMRLLARPRKMPSMMAGFGLTVTGYDEQPSDRLTAQETK
jgi:3,4-dihydroxy 2-butanone 4-phosphate synthase/GTP cyclohydrolase II